LVGFRDRTRNLRKALPNAAIIGFTGTPILSKEKKETREIFGDFIDKYILQDAELDGATVPILYEGRTADGTAITDAEFEKVLQAQGSSRARAAQMQHAARYHIIGFSNQNPAYARKMSERLEEILQRFKDDWNALERELRQLIDELRQGDRNDFPNLDAKTQVPFVRLVLEECGKGRELTAAQREQSIRTTLDMVERIRQEIRKVGFWKNDAMRELLTKSLVRDLNKAGVCRPGGERDLAQRLVALAKENHEALTRA
jgi:type I restriction enzyme R subunit